MPGSRRPRHRRPLLLVTLAALLGGMLGGVPAGTTVHPATADVAVHGAREVDAVLADLAAHATIPGTAWGVDPSAGQVVVWLDESVSPNERARLARVTARHGDAVRVEEDPGRLAPTIAGGEAIYSPGGRCTLGFNVRGGTANYALIAGHCALVGTVWYADPSFTQRIGTTAGSSFPGNDYGLVRYDGTVPPEGGVEGYPGLIDIVSAGSPRAGQAVRFSGPVGGVRTGQVLALNVTVNYAQGSVQGLIRTNICLHPGESGGPLFYDTVAYGIASGATGTCDSGGTSYFQPVGEPLGVYGLTLL
ncbi:S1 family peptidase [Allostreptomyces psammosilenae]|uniref:Streptogrisin D n=1 Tax=Allostreptomyces psammosilenae TaxID=1892865 RepID=A0A853AAE0_9ACTN|nr:S1 family peptidase [Allostreptomyces psammosilenae]NYI07342.1 streptogrisin D [Allostreptomyces psammosilenae]